MRGGEQGCGENELKDDGCVKQKGTVDFVQSCASVLHVDFAREE
jgi:hypothetical protein